MLDSLKYCNVRRDELRNLIRDSPIHIYLMQERLKRVVLEASPILSVMGKWVSSQSYGTSRTTRSRVSTWIYPDTGPNCVEYRFVFNLRFFD